MRLASADACKAMMIDSNVPGTLARIRYGYFPCKNKIEKAAELSALGVPPHSASSAEMAVYNMHASQLRAIGCHVGASEPRSFRGVQVQVGPTIVLTPSFAPCFTLMQSKFAQPEKVSITSRSSLVIIGANIQIDHLELGEQLTCSLFAARHSRLELLTYAS